MNERLYRTVDDRMVFGVLGGVSLRMGIDPSIARVVYAIVTILSGIFPLLIAYVIMTIVIPEAPAGYEAALRAGGRTPSGGAAGAAGWTGWATGPGSTAGPGEGAGAAGTPGWTADSGAAGGTTGATAGPATSWGAAWDEEARAADERRRGDDARMGALVGGLVLLGLGCLFLLVQLAPQLDWAVAGPVALIALGVVLILGSLRRA